MKVLVTGGAGFIGSNFVRFWLERHPDDMVINLDKLTYAGCLESLKDVVAKYPDHYAFVQADIGDTQTVTNVFEKYAPDVVVNFAAESHNSRAILNPGVFVETNVLGTQRLLDVARKQGIKRFHHISTCEVFGDMALDATDLFTESSPYAPTTPYNASKASADLIVRAYYRTFNVPVTISNCANNYGPYQFPEKVIPHFTIKGLRGEKLPLYRESKNRREWIHVLDHCAGIEAIVLHGTVGETYNIGSEFEADVETIADVVIKELGLTGEAKEYVPDRPQHDRRYLLSSKKIRETLGWKPTVEFSQGMHETIQWYRENEWWWKPLLAKLDINEGSWK